MAESAVRHAELGSQAVAGLVAGGALGMPRPRDFGLMAVETVGAETGVGIDSGPRVHVARMRELGEKLSGQAGIRQQSGRVRGDVTLLADSRIVRGAKSHGMAGDALSMSGSSQCHRTGLYRHMAGAALHQYLGCVLTMEPEYFAPAPAQRPQYH